MSVERRERHELVMQGPQNRQDPIVYDGLHLRQQGAHNLAQTGMCQLQVQIAGLAAALGPPGDWTGTGTMTAVL